jgi:hypothetical protein
LNGPFLDYKLLLINFFSTSFTYQSFFFVQSKQFNRINISHGIIKIIYGLEG